MATREFSGMESNVKFSEETTWGTAVAATNTVARVLTGSYDSKVNAIEHWNTGKVTMASASKGMVEVMGNLTFEISGSNDMNFFKYLIGGNRIGQGNSGTPHIIAMANQFGYGSGNAKSITLDIQHIGSGTDSNKDEVARINGVVFTDWTLSVSTNEVVKIDCNWEARTFTRIASASAYTPPTGRSLVFSDCTINLGGEIVLQVEDLTIKGTNEIETPGNLGTIYRQTPAFKKRTYEVEATLLMRYDDTASRKTALDLLGQYLGGSDTATSFADNGTLSKRNISIDISQGSATGDLKLEFNFKNGYITEVGLPDFGVDTGKIRRRFKFICEEGVSETVSSVSYVAPVKYWVA